SSLLFEWLTNPPPYTFSKSSNLSEPDSDRVNPTMARRLMSISSSSSSSSSSAPPIPRTSSFSTAPSFLRPHFPSSSSTAAAVALHFKAESRWRVKCMTSPDTKSESTSSTSSPTTTTPTTTPPSTTTSSFYWSAALGGIGFAETAYLTYLKLTNSTAFCPLDAGAAGGCTDILSSDYSVVFGVPLPLIGMAAYGLVAALGLQLSTNNLPFGVGNSDGWKAILLGTTTSMAATSGYLLYILTTQFPGESCPYCLFSAFLSFSLFLITIKDIGWQETQKALGLQLFIASVVIASLRFSYGAPLPFMPKQPEINLEYVPTEITTPSTPFTISLAKHLRSIGAKMYGAFWCSHCIEQKQMFGEEASKQLNYVECFPDGLNKNTKMALECVASDIKGFPTWVINDEDCSDLLCCGCWLQVIGGELTLSELADKSGFQQLNDNQLSSPALTE
ncbi:Thiol-disulfide oxidoreductase LTO1, partial [Linum grandiflorum]